MATRKEIIQETNARYWVGTGYKMGERLDPQDPVDQQHARRWLETFRDLMQQNARGTLTLLHKEPSYAQSLRNAISSYQVEKSLRPDDPRYREARLATLQARNDATMWQDMIESRGRATVSAWPWGWYVAPY